VTDDAGTPGDATPGDATAEDGTAEILVERSGAVAVVTLNRPGKLNALTVAMVDRLRELTEELDRDPGVRAIVLTGRGRAFCAGGDLTSLLPAALDAGWDILNPDPTQRFLSRVFTPVVAAVEGACMGGGFELLLGTDLRVAAAGATFGLPEGRWGLIPGSGTHVRLPAQVPWAVAMELLLLGRPIDAARACAVGLVNEVVAPGAALGRALELAEQIAAGGPLAARTSKEIAVRAAAHTDGYVLEHALNSRILTSADAREGVRSFQERRPARFEGR
jgi:enoyl-CoA hydratase